MRNSFSNNFPSTILTKNEYFKNYIEEAYDTF